MSGAEISPYSKSLSLSEIVRRCGGQVTAFKPRDMEAAENMLQLHQAKLRKAIQEERWPDCSAALRALTDEAMHAQKIAGELAMQSEMAHRVAEKISAKVVPSEWR